jgi:hypothetical protein
MRLAFITPLAALCGLVVLVPLAAAVVRERRAALVRRTIGLEPPARWSQLGRVAALLVAFGLLALAAAQPTLRSVTSSRVRTDAQVFVAFDTTGSMAAAEGRDAPTRFERAADFALRLRSGFPDVPVGVASLTNRPLPHLFPTSDTDAFVATVGAAVGVNRPPPGPDEFRRSTSFEPIKGFADENFFSPDSVERLVILLSDAESYGFAPRTLAAELEQGGVLLIVVRFWSATERIWLPSGGSDPGYETNPVAQVPVEELASLTAGGRVYDEHELSEVLAVSRGYLGEGPLAEFTGVGRAKPIGLYLVTGAVLPLVFLLWSGFSRPETGRRRNLHTVWSSRWRAFSRTVGRRSSRAQASPRPR